MNWRRGLLLAGINLVAAVPLILMLDARDEQYLREREDSAAPTFRSPMVVVAAPSLPHRARLIAIQEDQTVAFSPCGIWADYPPQMRVVTFGNLPAATLAEWREVCPSAWSLSGMLQGKAEWGLTRSKLASQRKVDAGLCLMIALQWFLVGAFQLRQPKKWWAEPGGMITALTLIATCFALIPSVDEAALVPALFASFAWFWWFGLLIWVTLRFGWRRIARLLPAHSR
jgi:hypothetical protein